MRFGIIFGLSHGGEVSVGDGPGLPDELNKKFKKLSLQKEHADLAELHLHEISLSSGRKRITFSAPMSEDDPNNLDARTIEELTDIGEEERIDLSGCDRKADYVERIRAFRGLNAEKIPNLKTIAKNEGVDLTGLKGKSEIVNTIAADRRKKAAAPAGESAD